MQILRKISATAAAFLLLSASASAATVKLGAVLAVTGPAAFLGKPEANTLQMAVASVNARGGIAGNKVELIIKDSGASPEKAISFAKQLLEEEHVLAVIGPSTSGESISLKPLLEAAKTPMISCAAAEVIVDPVAAYVFKTAQNDSFAIRKIFMEMKRQGLGKIAALVDNSGFGKAGKEQLAKLAPEYGIQIIATEVYDAKATDLSAVVAKIKANAGVQAVVNWSIAPAQSIVIKNIRQSGWQVPIFQSHGFANIKYAEAAGAAAEGVIFPAGVLLISDQLPAGHPQRPLLAQYRKDYENSFHEPVSAFGGYALDAFLMLEKAIATAGPDKDKIRTALESLKNFPGASGIFSFSATDHHGLNIDAFTMMTVRNGKFALYQGK